MGNANANTGNSARAPWQVAIVILLAVGFSVGAAVHLQAQHQVITYTIGGVIQGPGGKGVPGVMVYLDGAQKSYTVTDQFGGFRFTNLPPSRYTVQIGSVDGVTFTPSHRTIRDLRANEQIQVSAAVARRGRLIDLIADMIQIYEAGKTAKAFADGQGVIASVPGPAGIVGAWLAVLTGDPSRAMPPGLSPAFHCTPGKGAALFVNGRNVFGDRRVTWQDVEQCGQTSH